MKLIDNSYKYSFAVIENKLLKSELSSDIFKRIASDICSWNQKISSSPQVIYVLDKDLRGVHQFIESLFDEMIQYSENIPNNNLTFEEKVSIRKFREFSKFKQIKSEGRLVCPEDFGFTLFLEYESRFKTTCLNRTVYIKRVSNIDSLIEHLQPFENKLHTAGIYISEDLKRLFINKLCNLSIKYITSIGNMDKSIFDSPFNCYFLLKELTNMVFIDLKEV